MHDVVVQLRVRDAAGSWGTWTTLESDDVEQTSTARTPDEEVRGGTAPYWTDDAYGIEVIVQGAGGAVPEDVKVALVDPGTSTADKLPLESGAPVQAHAGTTQPAIATKCATAAAITKAWKTSWKPNVRGHGFGRRRA